MPGQTYTITPTITHATRMRFGFQLTVLRTSNNANAGGIQIIDTGKTWSQFPAYGSFQTREYAMHKKAGSYFTSTTGAWSFKWQAPATNVGNVKMYACFNAANNDDADTGDEVYFTTLTLTPGSTGIAEQNLSSSMINIFPNPANKYFDLTIDAREPGNLSVGLYSLEGKHVQHCLEKKIVQGKTNEIIYLNENLEPGIYFLRISIGNKVDVKKLIITGS